jgi:hypothetical protein
MGEVNPMRSAGMLALLPLLGAAQTPPSAALVKGVLLERDTPAVSGEFSVRTAGNQVFRYRFDHDTYVERENQLTTVPGINPGEKVEVLSDSLPDSFLRYARTVHVIDADPPPRPPGANRLRPGARTSLDSADRYSPPLPVGNLTFAGVVYRVTGERVVLHTRAGDQPILLRRDTRYVQDGESVDPASLKPNMRVFVRGGKDIWDQVEAYQVFWGEILQPR